MNLVLTTVCPGAYPCPGGSVAGPAAQQFQGLDFLGADGVSVTGVGGFGSPFFGTSAAAPHTAACDAIVRQLVGANAAPATIRSRLASTAVDFPPTGEDSVTGAGQVDCFAALFPPTAICQNRTVNTDPGVCTAANVSIDNGSHDNPSGPVTLMQSPAAPYSLGSTLVTLTATDADNLHHVLPGHGQGRGRRAAGAPQRPGAHQGGADRPGRHARHGAAADGDRQLQRPAGDE